MRLVDSVLAAALGSAFEVQEPTLPKIVDLEERKTQFVTASWEVIASEGLSAATLRRVAARQVARPGR